MFQVFYHDHSRPNWLARGMSLATLALLFTFFGFGVTQKTFANEIGSVTVSDTTIQVQICDNESYDFAGQMLDTAGVYSAVFTAVDGSDSTVTVNLTVLPVPVTNFQTGICEGSFYVFQGDTLTTSGTYTDTLTAANGCDSLVVLKLNVAAFFETNVEATICAGSSYLFHGVELTGGGIYVDSLTAAGGCDSVVTLNLNVLPVFATNLEAAICDGGVYSFAGEELTVEGIYTDSLVAGNGCDSLVTLVLHVFPTEATVVEEYICEGDVFVFGNDSLSIAGIYVDSLKTVNGCDSVITLTLHVIPASSAEVSATICSGDVYSFYGEELTESGVYTSIQMNSAGCDSTITLTLEVLPVAASSIEATICANQTYEFDGSLLSEEGTYTALYTAANGCDSTVTLTLQVIPFYETEIAATVCFGQTYNFEGTELAASGVYTATLTSTGGCDSVVVLSLTVLPEQQSAISATVCEGTGYTFDGQELFAAGVYTAVFTDGNGCDSTVTLTLSVLPVGSSSIEATICGNEGYPFYGAIVSETGVYTATLPGSNGCDSVITLTLTVLPVAETNLLAEICYGATYDYQGEILSETGFYGFIYTGANGCDSLVNLTLIVLPENITTTDLVLCTGSFYELNGDTLTTDGTYTAILTGADGCDSTLVVNLLFVNAFESSLSATVCNGQTYAYEGQELAESGVYTFQYTATGGCDSIVTLNLTVLPALTNALDVQICSNTSYEFNGNTLTEPGTYTAVYTAVSGCDSTVTLTLSVLPSFTGELAATICAGEGYQFNGAILTESGVYTSALTASNGCDSTVVLTLNVLPVAGSQTTATICSGAGYPFNGTILSQSGTYTALFTAANGCDSTVSLVLTVNPSVLNELSVTICSNETYPFNGQNLNTSGSYEFNGTGANGCDSTVVLNLEVLPVKQTSVDATSCNGQPYIYNNTPLTVGGSYVFPFTAANGCDSTVLLNLEILPVIPPTQINTEICEGDFVMFNGNILTSPGTYSATYLSNQGCDSVVILTLTVFEVNTTVILGGNTLTAAATNVQYQWINCDNQQIIPGATGATFTPTVTGNYAVVITTPFGCTGTSQCTNVMVSSTGEAIADLAWSVQPNPAVSSIVVAMNTEGNDRAFTMTITDLAGRQMMQRKIATGATQEFVDITSLPNGIYLIKLSDSLRSSEVKRFVKTSN